MAVKALQLQRLSQRCDLSAQPAPRCPGGSLLPQTPWRVFMSRVWVWRCPGALAQLCLVPAAIRGADTSYGCCSTRARFGRCFTPRGGWGWSIWRSAGRRRIAAGCERGGSELHALLWRIPSCSWRLGSGRRGVFGEARSHTPSPALQQTAVHSQLIIH